MKLTQRILELANRVDQQLASDPPSDLISELRDIAKQSEEESTNPDISFEYAERIVKERMLQALDKIGPPASNPCICLNALMLSDGVQIEWRIWPIIGESCLSGQTIESAFAKIEQCKASKIAKLEAELAALKS